MYGRYVAATCTNGSYDKRWREPFHRILLPRVPSPHRQSSCSARAARHSHRQLHPSRAAGVKSTPARCEAKAEPSIATCGLSRREKGAESCQPQDTWQAHTSRTHRTQGLGEAPTADTPAVTGTNSTRPRATALFRALRGSSRVFRRARFHAPCATRRSPAPSPAAGRREVTAISSRGRTESSCSPRRQPCVFRDRSPGHTLLPSEASH